MMAMVTITADKSPPYLCCRVKVWVGDCRIPWTRVVKVLALGNVQFVYAREFGTPKHRQHEKKRPKHPAHARAYEVVHDVPSTRSPPSLYLTPVKNKKQALRRKSHRCEVTKKQSLASTQLRRIVAWHREATVPYTQDGYTGLKTISIPVAVGQTT